MLIWIFRWESRAFKQFVYVEWATVIVFTKLWTYSLILWWVSNELMFPLQY